MILNLTRTQSDHRVVSLIVSCFMLGRGQGVGQEVEEGVEQGVEGTIQ